MARYVTPTLGGDRVTVMQPAVGTGGSVESQTNANMMLATRALREVRNFGAPQTDREVKLMAAIDALLGTIGLRR
jgi:hypothetical protein